MTEVDRFADIRPYRDEEVPAAIERLIQDDEFIGAIAKYRFGSLMSWLGWAIRPLIRQFLRHKWAKVSTVHQVQMGVTRYMTRYTIRTRARGPDSVAGAVAGRVLRFDPHGCRFVAA